MFSNNAMLKLFIEGHLGDAVRVATLVQWSKGRVVFAEGATTY